MASSENHDCNRLDLRRARRRRAGRAWSATAALRNRCTLARQVAALKAQAIARCAEPGGYSPARAGYGRHANYHIERLMDDAMSI